MKAIKEFLFGRRANAVCQAKPGFHTTHAYREVLNYGDWCERLHVTMVADKTPFHIEDDVARDLIRAYEERKQIYSSKNP